VTPVAFTVHLNSIRNRTAFESERRDISANQACGTDKSDVDVCDSTAKRSICPSFFTHRANPPGFAVVIAE
jgi:hypothetical protein